MGSEESDSSALQADDSCPKTVYYSPLTGKELQYSHLYLGKRLWATGLKEWLLEHLDSHLKSAQCVIELL